MKSHGLLMTPDLIRATLAGIKTETRRIPTPRNCTFDGGTWPKELVKDGAWKTELDWNKAYIHKQHGAIILRQNKIIRVLTPRYQPGETIYVKEAWCVAGDGQAEFYYKADGDSVYVDDGDGFWQENKDGTLKSPWKSPLFMPREAARIVRPVLSVGFEWLHNITPQSAKAEGLETVDGFMDTWLKINGNTDNQIVLVYKFGKENLV